MSYTSHRSSPATVAAVVAVHVAIGYALLSGLAVRLIPDMKVVTLATQVPDDISPPPPLEPARPHARSTTSEPRPATPETVVDLPPLPTQSLPALPPIPTVPLPDVRPAEPAPALDLARGAAPRGDRTAWVTTGDYPAAALRAGAEGTTGIRVAITADGRVGDCTVTLSSGSDALDRAACQAYARRARFEPARDAAGRPVESVRADRVMWRLPR